MNVRVLSGVSAGTETEFNKTTARHARRVCNAPYVIPDHPATHAFVAVFTPDMAWRLDAQVPLSQWSAQVHGWGREVALWEVKAEEGELRTGLDYLLNLSPVVYDPIEIAAQMLPGLELLEMFPGAKICTSLTLDVLGHFGPHWKALVQRIKNHSPECLAQEQRACQEHWWCRRYL